VVAQNVTLASEATQPQLDGVVVADNPWPAALLDGSRTLPPRPISPSVEVRLPPDLVREGEPVALRVILSIEYPVRAASGDGVELMRAEVRRDWTLRVATERDRDVLGRYLSAQTWLRRGIFASVAFMVFLAFGAMLFAQRRLSIVCSKCGRVTTGSYYHEGGTLSVSPCPHRLRGHAVAPASLPPPA